MAPHGGRIEPGTTEIAEAIAGEEHFLYSFMGFKPRDNRSLHITSTRFDEPTACRLLKDVRTVLTIHGCAGEEEVTLVGGRDLPLVESLKASLVGAGFEATSTAAVHLRGLNPQNLCNQGLSRAGAQLELSASLRKRLLAARAAARNQNSPDLFDAFVSAVRQTLASASKR